jgi:hypothetical protein
MNKNICLVLPIIFIVLIVMGSGAYSWSWIECGGGIKEISDGNDQADGRIILLTRRAEYHGLARG